MTRAEWIKRKLRVRRRRVPLGEILPDLWRKVYLRCHHRLKGVYRLKDEEQIPEEEIREGSDLPKDGKKHRTAKRNLWPLKVTVITLFLSAFFSFFTEIISTKSNLVVALLICILLVIISIIFDGIGVSVTNCDVGPLTAMAARKVPGSKRALKLVQNSEKVSSICCDVIGDICGVVSGACSAAIVIRIIAYAGDTYQLLYSIIASAFIAALTVGGKAFEKTVAIKNSKEMVMLTARIICFFTGEDRKERKNAKKTKSSD